MASKKKSEAITPQIPWQARQGDVFLMATDAKAKTKAHVEVPREGGAIVLAHGTSTGHSHAIHTPGAKLFAAEGIEDRLLVVAETARLTHEEHGPVEIEPGTYIVRRQREWSGEDERVVMD